MSTIIHVIASPGHFVVKDLVEACKSNDVTDLVVLHEHRGVPDGMVG